VKSPASAGSVYVGCKLPHGLRLQLTREVEQIESVPGQGQRTFKIHRRIPNEVHVLKGIALGKGERPNYPIVGGASITKVPAAFWEKWLEQNKTHPAILNNLVFAQATSESIRDQARELRKEKSGFEPIDPDPKAKDPRMKGVKTVKKDDETDEDFEEVEA
jgi:hypothetical protein